MLKVFALGVALLSLAAAAAGGIMVDTTALFTFDNCDVGGSAAQTVTNGRWLLTVDGEAVFVCIAASGATCAAGGTRLPSGTVMVMEFGGTGRSVACRSAGSSGDLQFTKQIN